MTTADTSGAPPARLGKYAILRELARTALSLTYKAEDPESRHPVTLQVFSPTLLRPDALERIEREAALAARLQHANIIATKEVGSTLDDQGREAPFIASESIRGPTLADLLRDRKTPQRTLVQILYNAARAAGHAHSKGVVHRDLTPARIHIESPSWSPGSPLPPFSLPTRGTQRPSTDTRQGRSESRPPSPRIVVSAFGIAESELLVSLSPRIEVHLETLLYLAPEQIDEKKTRLAPPTDVYALGAILYEILTSTPPFTAPSLQELRTLITHRRPIPPRRRTPSVEPKLDLICLKAMDKSPETRYANGNELADDLARFLFDEPILARPRRAFSDLLPIRRIASAATVLLVLTLLVALLLTHLAHRRARQETLDALKPIEQTFREARPWFYVQGDIRDRLRDVEVALEKAQTLSENSRAKEISEVWTALGTGRYLVADEHRAEEALLHAIALAPEDPPAHTLLGRIYQERSMVLRLGPYAGLEEVVRTRIQTLSEKAAAHLNLAIKKTTGAVSLDQHVTQTYRVASLGDSAALRTRCEEGLRLFEGKPGTEDYCCLLATLSPPSEALDWLDRAISRRPHYAWTYLLRAQIKSRDNPATALEDFDHALKLGMQSALSFHARGRVRARMGDHVGAIADFTDAIRCDPQEMLAYIDRARERIESGAAQEAIIDLDEAIHLSPRCATAYAIRARAKHDRGDLAAAESDVEQALRWNPDLAIAYSMRGILAMTRNAPDRAIQEFDRAIALDPDSVESYTQRGLAHAARRAWSSAIADFSDAIQRQPTASLYEHRARAYEAAENPTAAIADWSEVIRLNPDHATAHQARGALQRSVHAIDTALADLTRAIDLDPHNAKLFYERGTVRVEQGDPAGALQDFDQALNLDPSFSSALLSRANAHLQLRNWSAAAADYDAYLSQAPESAEAYAARGRAHLELGRMDAALSDFSDALTRDPARVSTLIDRAKLRMHRHDLDGASTDLEEAVRLAPNDAAALGYRGLLRFVRHDFAGAVTDLENALKLAPAGSPDRAAFEQTLEQARRGRGE